MTSSGGDYGCWHYNSFTGKWENNYLNDPVYQKLQKFSYKETEEFRREHAKNLEIQNTYRDLCQLTGQPYDPKEAPTAKSIMGIDYPDGY